MVDAARKQLVVMVVKGLKEGKEGKKRSEVGRELRFPTSNTIKLIHRIKHGH